MLDFLIGNDLLSAIVAFGIVLIPAVIVHELGHFLAAKAVGITVLEFGIGFPPRVARMFTWRETEFTLNWIPLGGFVRPLGEDFVGPNAEKSAAESRDVENETPSNDGGGEYRSEREELAARGFYDVKSVNEVKPLPRMFFMFAGALGNFIFAFLVFILIALIGVPEVVGARLGLLEVPEQSPLTEIGLEAGDMIERVDGAFFQDGAQLTAMLADRQGQETTIQVRRTTTTPNEIFTVDFTPDDEFIALLSGVRQFVLVTGVGEDSPANEAGLQAGDLIASVDGESLNLSSDAILRLQTLAEENAGQEILLEIYRNGQRLEIMLIPRENPPPNTGRIGIEIGRQFTNTDGSLVYMNMLHVDTVPQPAGEAVRYGSERVGAVFGLIAEFPVRLLEGSTEPEERRVISAVGASQLGGAILQDSIDEGQIGRFLEYVALISIALGFTNLLPIPALDGGRILFVFIELIRGKPIPPEREGIVHLMGLIFLLSVGVLFIINDLLNPLTDLLPR